MTIGLSDAVYGDHVTAPLLSEIQHEMAIRYGGHDETAVDPVQFSPPTGCFVVATVDGEVIGCAGLRGHGRNGPGTAELKRLYVRAAHRRHGHAQAILAAMEDRARVLGHQRIILETGTAQPEAIALYERAGYTVIPGFGHYAEYDESRCYAKQLGKRPSRPT